MSDRNTSARLCDSALIRCRKAFSRGVLPSNIGDLALALESDCITISEVEYIEKLIGDHAEMQVS